MKFFTKKFGISHFSHFLFTLGGNISTFCSSKSATGCTSVSNVGGNRTVSTIFDPSIFLSYEGFRENYKMFCNWLKNCSNLDTNFVDWQPCKCPVNC